MAYNNKLTMVNLGSEIRGLFFSVLLWVIPFSALSIYLFHNYKHYLKNSLLFKKFPFHCHSLSLSLIYTLLPYPSPPYWASCPEPQPLQSLPTVAPLTIGLAFPSAPVINSWWTPLPRLPSPLTPFCWKPPPSGCPSSPALQEPGMLSLFQLLYQYIHWATLFCSLVCRELFTGTAWPFVVVSALCLAHADTHHLLDGTYR